MNVSLANDYSIVQNDFTFEVSERERNKLLSAIEVLKTFFDPIPDITSRPYEFYLYQAERETCCGSVSKEHLDISIRLIENLINSSEVHGTFKYKIKAGN